MPRRKVDKSNYPVAGLWDRSPNASELKSLSRVAAVRFLIATAMIVAVDVWYSTSEFSRYYGIDAIILESAAVLAVCAIAIDAFRRQAARKFRQRVVEHNDDDAFVEVRINREPITIGVDFGAMWFEGGLLHFHGSACSFALAPQQLHRVDGKYLVVRTAGVLPISVSIDVLKQPLREPIFIERMSVFADSPAVEPSTIPGPPTVPYWLQKRLDRRNDKGGIPDRTR